MSNNTNTNPLLKPRLSSLTKPTWLYPLKGLCYYLTHPQFYPLFRARLLPITLLSAFILTNLFLFTYLPQVAFLAIFHGAGAWVNATFLVLGEGAAIVSLLFEAFFVDETCVDVFDAVLVAQGCEELVAKGRVILEPVAGVQGSNPIKRLGKPVGSAVYSPFSLRQIIEFIMLLPLNLIPVVGTPMFLLLTGWRAGPLHHWRYFKLRGLSKKERNREIKGRGLRYTWFGMVALLLQLVPVLSMFFLLTTAAGSALWVVDLEERRKRVEGETTAEQPEYTDDPV